MKLRAPFRATSTTAALITIAVAAEAVLITGGVPWTLASNRPAPLPILLAKVAARPRPRFEAGVVFPQWGVDAYGPLDPNWALGLGQIRQETNADWVEMTVNLRQPTFGSVRIEATPRLTPTPAGVAAGIRLAHRDGFHVFLVPLVTVATVPHWEGMIPAGTVSHARAWFRAYWRSYGPFVRAAAKASVDQVAIGTELARMEHAPPALWDRLLARFRRVYPGPLTYDRNHASADDPLLPWMHSPLLSTLGISTWYPVAGQPVAPGARLDAIWHDRVGRHLDRNAKRLGKPVVISEIGYRSSADCLSQPYRWRSRAPFDPACQADAYWAAMHDIASDPHVRGIFVWAWSVPVFEPNGLPGARVLREWFSALEGLGAAPTRRGPARTGGHASGSRE